MRIIWITNTMGNDIGALDVVYVTPPLPTSLPPPSLFSQTSPAFNNFISNGLDLSIVDLQRSTRANIGIGITTLWSAFAIEFSEAYENECPFSLNAVTIITFDREVLPKGRSVESTDESLKPVPVRVEFCNKVGTWTFNRRAATNHTFIHHISLLLKLLKIGLREKKWKIFEQWNTTNI